MMRERFYYFLFLRYVDDVRLILPALLKGCYWNWENFYFSTEQEEADVKAGMNTELPFNQPKQCALWSVSCSLKVKMDYVCRWEITNFRYCIMG